MQADVDVFGVSTLDVAAHGVADLWRLGMTVLIAEIWKSKWFRHLAVSESQTQSTLRKESLQTIISSYLIEVWQEI